MLICGYRKSDFYTKDQKEIKGYNVFTQQEIVENGRGLQTDKFYLSEQKVMQMNIDLDALVGHEVQLYYNRWGKVEAIQVLKWKRP